MLYPLKVDDFWKKPIFSGSFHFAAKNVVQKITKNIFLKIAGAVPRSYLSIKKTIEKIFFKSGERVRKPKG